MTEFSWTKVDLERAATWGTRVPCIHCKRPVEVPTKCLPAGEGVSFACSGACAMAACRAGDSVEFA